MIDAGKESMFRSGKLASSSNLPLPFDTKQLSLRIPVPGNLELDLDRFPD